MHRAVPSLIALTLAGCSAEAVIDLENARNEALFVPAEAVGTLGFAVAQAQNYGERAVVAQNALALGNSPDEEGCSAVSVTDAITDDGLGSVMFDFNSCPSREGRVHVDQESALELPEGWDEDDWENWDGDLPDGWENDVPDGWGGDERASVDMPETRDNFNVRFTDYSVSIVDVRGAVSVDGDSTGGEVGAHVGIRALDYDTLASVHGRWTPMVNEPGKWISFGGRFSSLTGVQWTIVADNLGFMEGGDCLDAVGGEVTAVFENEAGRTEVTATFDDVCDGCAAVAVDGIDQGEACFSASDLIGG